MPGSVNTPRPTLTTDSAEDYFSSAFTEMQSYLEYPVGDAKSQQDPRSPRLTPPIRSPNLNAQSNSPALWSSFPDSPGITGYQPIYHLESEKQNTASLRHPSILSPPKSSEPSPQKFAQPVEISPLDSILAGFPTDGARTVHGQVTPPDDPMQSPNVAPLPAASFPFNITPPERSPVNSLRNSLSMSPRLQPSMCGMSDMMDRAESSKRRRSSTAQSSSGSRKRRKSNENEEAPEIQEAKRRRFLERNRVAASKCRQKKKQWMQELETDAREAQNASKQLKIAVSMLREEILRLKNELLKHNTCDCTPIRQYLSNEAARLAEGPSVLSSLDNRRTSTTSDLSSAVDELKMGSTTEDADDFDMIASPDAV